MLTMKIFSFIMKVRFETHFHKGVVMMQIKVMPLCLGMGIGMIVMKMICMKSCTSESECLKEECNTCSKEQGKEKVMTKAKEKISQIVSDIEKLEMEDVKAKTKEALGQIKQKVLSIHL